MKLSTIFHARGASMTEFLVVAPVLLGLGGGTLQAALAYHGKTTLNYATLEAARTGATHHALEQPMSDELGIRLAPLIGGDGTPESAVSAILRSRQIVATDPLLRLEIINPTLEAFDAYKKISRESGEEVIPNSHLRHQSNAIDAASGVSLQDANLLKIKVTYGLEMKVPVIGAIVAAVMPALDPPNARYYRAHRLPLTSVATVRMQSEVHGDSLVSREKPPEPGTDEPRDGGVVVNEPGIGSPPGSVDGPGDGQQNGQENRQDSSASGATCTGDGTDPMLPTVDQLSCEGVADSPSIFSDTPAAESSAVTTATGTC